MNLIQLINNNLTTVDFEAITTVQAKECRTFEELMQVYRNDMTVTQSLEDCMALCIATHIAVKLDGDPLWLYLVGAPSSGKSTLCELICADEHNTKPLSKFTGLVTGSRQGQHLAPMLAGKCVVVKDATLLLETGPQTVGNIFGELRDIYDGSLEANYRNGVHASISGINFGMILGITEQIYSINNSNLGERFLHCRLETSRATELKRNQSAIDSIFQNTSKTDSENEDSRSFPTQRAYTAGFLNHLHTRIRQEDVLRPSYTEDDKDTIQALADVVACSRASVAKDSKDRVLYDGSPESSTRVVKQLTRAALVLCYVYDTEKITSKIISQIRKLAIDSSHGRQYNVLLTLAKHPHGMTRRDLGMSTNIPLESCNRIIEDLQILKIINEAKETGMRAGSGRKNYMVTLAPWIRKAFEKAHALDRPQKKKASSNSRTTTKRPLRKKKVPRTRS